MLKGDEILDDFSEGSGLTGTREEWTLGLFIGGFLQVLLVFFAVKMMTINLYGLSLEIGPFMWNPSLTIPPFFTFLITLCYLILTKSWKQPLSRVKLLLIVSFVIGGLALIGALDYYAEALFGDYDVTIGAKKHIYIAISFMYILLFSIVFLLFRPKYRAIGFLLLMAIIIILGLKY